MLAATALRVIVTIFVAAIILISSPSASWAREMIEYPRVKLRALEKTTARTKTFEARVGSTVKFGSLYIAIKSCQKSSPVDMPESAAFLQIWEVSPKKEENGDSASKWVFSGWMFASSPALSPMNHPIYDVWVLDCLKDETKSGSASNSENGDTLEKDSAQNDTRNGTKKDRNNSPPREKDFESILKTLTGEDEQAQELDRNAAPPVSNDNTPDRTSDNTTGKSLGNKSEDNGVDNGDKGNGEQEYR